ncbi:hypothetical protein KIN20_025031 [Parelaphostrongylus tenuis]|uniref:Uncharacterized protein n=1 Tax=Parelaphostrongylus tenuis TaxID=148309 RepID=A0AAD5NBK8_PARTN|nr:hypothetical protein KIN20_025031 [Parelaphostrongylus tenuis]
MVQTNAKGGWRNGNRRTVYEEESGASTRQVASACKSVKVEITTLVTEFKYLGKDSRAAPRTTPLLSKDSAVVCPFAIIYSYQNYRLN